ncbi:MAG TPA: glycosyltransferase [Gemmatimonadales bacterium]|nr:glycosyltransferase [Gemmatimonadales bacterium]
MSSRSLSPRQWRLLFLLHCAPRFDASHGGGRLIAQLLRALADRHRLGVIYLRDRTEPAIDDVLRQCCELVEEVPRSNAPRTLLQRAGHRIGILLAPLLGMPRWAAHLPGAECAGRVRRIAGEWQPDIVQLEFSVMARYLDALDDCPAPRLLTHHMPGADTVPSALLRGGGWRLPGRWLDRRAWRRFEQRVVNEMQAVVTFTERDRRAIHEWNPALPVTCIPPSIAVPEQPLNPAGHAPPTVAFVGNYGHPPNRDAAERLARYIMPLVRRRCPDAVLSLVGNRPPAALRRLQGAEVKVPGWVADVSPYLNDAAVVAAPVRLGGGIRVKVLEALAAGKAIVASALAVEGMDVTDGVEVVLAATDQEFADRITELLLDPTRRMNLAARARAWACVNLGARRSIEAYERIYRELLADRRQVPSA